MLSECARAVAWWFGSSSGLYTIMGVILLLGVLIGWGTARHLPARLRDLLGV